VKAARSGLLTRTATETVLSCAPRKFLPAFLELERGDTRVRGEFDLVTAKQKRAAPIKADSISDTGIGDSQKGH
jgi:hypothetical protein